MQMQGFSDVSEVLGTGVYALVYKGVVVYIGKAKAMLTRVYTHRSMWSAARRGKAPKWMPIKGILYDQVFVQPCAIADLDALEREMIELYKPKYNVLLKTQDKISVPIALQINGVDLCLNDPTEGRPMERRF